MLRSTFKKGSKQSSDSHAEEQGILVGISAGANILGAERWLANNEIDGAAVTFLCDRGERYMSLF